jgi:hypothetical protein
LPQHPRADASGILVVRQPAKVPLHLPRSPHPDPIGAIVAPMTASLPSRAALAGTVERVTFHNAESGFCVLGIKARGHRDLVTIVGHAAIIAAGEWIAVSGEWVNDRTHGQQFKARFMRTSAPSSIEGIEKYLASSSRHCCAAALVQTEGMAGSRLGAARCACLIRL